MLYSKHKSIKFTESMQYYLNLIPQRYEASIFIDSSLFEYLRHQSRW